MPSTGAASTVSRSRYFPPGRHPTQPGQMLSLTSSAKALIGSLSLRRPITFHYFHPRGHKQDRRGRTQAKWTSRMAWAAGAVGAATARAAGAVRAGESGGRMRMRPARTPQTHPFQTLSLCRERCRAAGSCWRCWPPRRETPRPTLPTRHRDPTPRPPGTGTAVTPYPRAVVASPSRRPVRRVHATRAYLRSVRAVKSAHVPRARIGDTPFLR